MSDDVARAVGAKGSTVMIAGKECTVRPLSLREMTEVERDCLDRYRRSYLKTFSENTDLLPKECRERIVQDEMMKAARWDVDDLPKKMAHDSDRIQLTKAVKGWVKKNYPEIEEEKEEYVKFRKMKVLVAASLDEGLLSGKDYKSMSNAEIPQEKVPYIHWWITGCYEGMVTMVWQCFRADGVTREQVMKAVGENQGMLTQISREIEMLSTPAAGNG